MNMEKIPETDQWLLDGICNKCRRQSYCKKTCTRSARRREAMMYSFMEEKLNESTGGAFGRIMSHSNFKFW